MSATQSESTMPGRIHILPGDVAKKIAAGEVIDRPFSVLRELIDNAIDAGADDIEVYIESGGIRLIEIRDNGSGMPKEDLQLCWKSHATSKLRHEDDLLEIRTLGFRGEALSSISAVSRLEIVSRTTESPKGYRLNLEGGSSPRIMPTAATIGTRIQVSDLFYNLPARKKFLKSSSAESRLCRNTFLEKAAAHPGISFRLFVDGKPKDLLPKRAAQDFLGRISEIYPDKCPPKLMGQSQQRGDGFGFHVVYALPPLHRNDRKLIQIFCNQRRIHEFSLIHAVEYAMDPLLPGGTYPIAFVFLNVEPSQADFNIHPAKREVRFSRPDIIHRSLRTCLQRELDSILKAAPTPHKALSDVLHGTDQVLDSDQQAVSAEYHVAQSEGQAENGNQVAENLFADEDNVQSRAVYQKAFTYHSQFDARLSSQSSPVLHEKADIQDASVMPVQGEQLVPPYRYLGQIFSLFLLAEIGDTLYAIDMHAAHERILFDRYRASSASEQLLIPIVIDLEEGEDSTRADDVSAELNTIGFDSRKTENGMLEIRAIPSALHGKERLLARLIREVESDAADMENKLYENMACKAAIRDGDVIDRQTACFIIEESWKLPVKRCPHGRPIWFAISRDELFQLVGREI